MSASREKKQRQGAGPSEKATQVQKEQAAYKRKARIYTVIGIVVVVLVAALLVWNSGLFQSKATAATIGDEQLSAAELSYYYYDARYVYAMYGLIDSSKADDEQFYSEAENLTYRDFFLETALSNAQQVKSLYHAALANGHTLSEVKDEVAEQVASMKTSAANNNYSYKAFLKAVYGRYMTPSVFEDQVAQSLLGSLYYEEVSGEKLDAITAEELAAYYEEHKDDLDEIEYSYLYFKPETVDSKDEDGNERSEDEMKELAQKALDAAKAKAEDTLAQYEAGVSIADLIEAGKPTSSLDHTTVQGVSNISAIYSEELLALGADEADLVEADGNGYYVVIFHSRGRNEDLTANVRHILFRAETTTDDNGKVVAPSEEAWAKAKADAEAALAEYEAGEKTAEAFGELANKYSSDTGSNTKGGLYENVAEGNFVTEFNDWIFSEDRPEAGDTALIRHEGDVESTSAYWGYHVAFLQEWDDAEWELATRKAMLNETMTQWSEDLAAGYETALANGAKHLGT